MHEKVGHRGSAVPFAHEEETVWKKTEEVWEGLSGPRLPST